MRPFSFPLVLLACACLFAGAAVIRLPSALSEARAAGIAPAGTPEAALACVAARYRGHALAVRWRDEDGHWEVRWLTPAQSVLRIRLQADCRFEEISGVGQENARIPPTSREAQ